VHAVAKRKLLRPPGALEFVRDVPVYAYASNELRDFVAHFGSLAREAFEMERTLRREIPQMRKA
jgi:hypothetical protein